MRLIDADAFCAFLREVSTRQHYETLLTNKDKYPTVADVIEAICCDLDGTSLNGFDNAPTVIATEDCISREGAINALSHDRVCCNVCRKALETILPVELTERPQGEWIENKHRLNLLIGVLYSNQLISESDLEYIEDSINKLMKGGAE